MTTKSITKKVDGYTPAQLALVTRTVAKGATPDELAMFMHTAKTTGLNPFLKEVYFYKVPSNKGGEDCVIMTGRDGFLSIAQKSGEFAGLQSAAVYEGDDFSIDYSTNTIKHIGNPRGQDPTKGRGALIGAWAKVNRKGCEPNITYVDFVTYNKGKRTWATHPAAMIIKCAESIALKKQFGISGLVSTEEMGYEPQPEIEAPKLDNEKAFAMQFEKIKEITDADKRKTAALKMLEVPPFTLKVEEIEQLKSLTK